MNDTQFADLGNVHPSDYQTELIPPPPMAKWMPWAALVWFVVAVLALVVGASL